MQPAVSLAATALFQLQLCTVVDSSAGKLIGHYSLCVSYPFKPQWLLHVPHTAALQILHLIHSLFMHFL
jgi:hypothetical protein